LEWIFPVSPGSKSFSRNFVPSSTRYGFTSVLAQLIATSISATLLDYSTNPAVYITPRRSRRGIFARTAVSPVLDEMVARVVEVLKV
jgi:hypothetical protein